MREVFRKFFADRGTHLAAMIAYFALLSFLPLLFLAFALLGLTGRANESSYLVTELKRAFPGSSVSSLVAVVRTIQRNATTLGIVGGAALLWASLSLFSVLESALNIVYGRPNRSFLRGKALAVVFMTVSLVTLFVGLLAGSIGFDLLRHFAPGFFSNSIVAYTLSVIVSILALFLFLISAYYRLPNTTLTMNEVLPGAIFAGAVGQLERDQLARAIAAQAILELQAGPGNVRDLAKITGAVDQLDARVRELEGRRALNSRNSHKPPSSDGFDKKTKSRRKKSGNKPGGPNR